MWKRTLCALAIAHLPLLTGCAGSTNEPAMELRMQHAAQLLEHRADADSLAAAGLLNSSWRRDRSLSLIEQASALEPQRADLVWLQIQICQREPACPPEPLESRLQRLDSANGAGWLGALSRGNQAHDEQAKFAALKALSRSERLDTYWTTLVARLSRAMASTKTVPLQQAEVSIIGILAAQAIPAYSAIGNACKGEVLQRSEVLDVCRGAAQSLQHGDTYIAEMVGISIAKRVWPEESPEWRDAAESRRVFEYRSHVLADSTSWSVAHADVFLSLCAQNRREQDVYGAQVIALGRSPDPPSL